MSLTSGSLQHLWPHYKRRARHFEWAERRNVSEVHAAQCVLLRSGRAARAGVRELDPIVSGICVALFSLQPAMQP